MSSRTLSPLQLVSEDPEQRANLLSRSEKELLARILEQAESLSAPQTEVLSLMQTAIARAVGEVLLQRSAERTGAAVMEIIRASGPHPPTPPGPHGAPVIPPSPPSPPAPVPVPPAGPHPPVPPGPHGSVSRKTQSVESVELPRELRAVYATAEEFLMPAQLEELVRYTSAHESDFVVSEVVSPGVQGRGSVDHEYRRSHVLLSLAEYEALFLERIQGMLPEVFQKLQMAPFVPARAEVQITASNDGDFFRDHSDNGHTDIASRALTFVYFFHAEPKPFRGGDLRLYDSRRGGDVWVRQGAGHVVVPEQNQIVFFPSELVHEITPVICPSKSFGDSRFTVNGWLHRP